MAHIKFPDGTPISHDDPNYGDWYDWAMQIEEERWRRANYTGPVYQPEMTDYTWDTWDEHRVKPRLDDEWYYWIDTAAHGGSGGATFRGESRLKGVYKIDDQGNPVYKDPDQPHSVETGSGLDPYGGGRSYPYIRKLPDPTDEHWDLVDTTYAEAVENWSGKEVWVSTVPTHINPDHPDADEDGYVSKGYYETVPRGYFASDFEAPGVADSHEAEYQSNIVNWIQGPTKHGDEPIAWSQDGEWVEFDPDIHWDIYGGYDGFNFGDPKDTEGITGNDQDGRPIIGNEGLPPSTATLTPFPTPPTRGIGSVVLSPSLPSLDRDRIAGTQTGYTGVPMSDPGTQTGYTGIPMSDPGTQTGNPGIPISYPGAQTGNPGINPLPNFTNNNPMKIYNNKVRRTGDLARTSGRFLRTLTL